jgi:hypothetical protein
MANNPAGTKLGAASLSDTAAESLAQKKGGLFLNGLTKLSDEAAKALAKTESLLFLDGLTTLSAEAVKTLMVNPRVRLPDKFKR